MRSDAASQLQWPMSAPFKARFRWSSLTAGARSATMRRVTSRNSTPDPVAHRKHPHVDEPVRIDDGFLDEHVGQAGFLDAGVGPFEAGAVGRGDGVPQVGADEIHL